ncbi:hypothetical protein [Massilia sp. DWR3-1-1]|uniref:hypothetical protein n=1 Tax=Massilia sp. DWR3-1-1 TaxID=2804559 RepID=UPI003CF21C6E
MRKKFGHALRLGISADGVALLETRRWGREATLLAELPLDASHAFPVALAGAVTALLNDAQRDGWPLSVVLADELVRFWQVTPPPACARMADLEAAAALRFQQLYGEPAAGWQLRADWQLTRPFLAAAIPVSLVAALQQATSAHAMRLIEVAPQFVVLFNRWRAGLAAGDWFGVVHDGVLTLGVCDGGIVAMRALAIDAAASAPSAWLQGQLAREALRLNRPAPERLRLCGAAPAAWAALPGCVLLDQADATASPLARLAGAGSAA